MEAEDVSQETFIRFLKAAQRYRPTASFRTYLFGILTRLCIDHSRKKRPVSTSAIPDLADPSSSPADDLLARERSALIRMALAVLPPNQKIAILLRHYEGLSYAEIAEILGVTPKAVERLLSRARAALQSRLSDPTRN
jgi:RNA polymerase sigma-70 factor, ECF subfamily